MTMTRSQYVTHFSQVEPLLVPYIQSLPEERLPVPKKYDSHELFHRLCEDVIGQQLSGKVATVITGRFAALFPESVATPPALLALAPDDLRAIGMSWAKVRTVRDLAEKSVAGEIPWNKLQNMSDAEVVATLLPVWGVGEWTAEMFLLFTLGRLDVFSPKDLGLKKGMQLVYGLDEMPGLQAAAERAQAWAPYRSVASLALWWALDNPSRRDPTLSV